VVAGEIIFAPAPTASRRANFSKKNLRSVDSSSPWSFKHSLLATLSAFLRRHARRTALGDLKYFRPDLVAVFAGFAG
jgi:hypothetical protein